MGGSFGGSGIGGKNASHSDIIKSGLIRRAATVSHPSSTRLKLSAIDGEQLQRGMLESIKHARVKGLLESLKRSEAKVTFAKLPPSSNKTQSKRARKAFKTKREAAKATFLKVPAKSKLVVNVVL